MSRQRRVQRRRGRKSSFPAKLLLVAAVVLAVPLIAVIAAFSYFHDLTDDVTLARCKSVPKTGNTVIFAADGSKLGYVSTDLIRSPATLATIPKQLQFATVAIEDRRFFERSGGVDPEGIARAAYEDLTSGEAKQGGSTITQQLVRNLCIKNPQDTIKRKAIEAKLAELYFDKHSKKEILDQYLNVATYGTLQGATAVGVGAASKVYFGKPVSKLDLVQSALLAGLPQAPSQYNPVLNPAAAKARRNLVLKTMADVGYITEDRARAAQQSGLELDPTVDFFDHREPYFFDYVTQRLIDRYGVNTVRRGGLRVYTTLDPSMQTVATDALHSTLPYSTDPSSALVAINPRSGEIKTMANSTSYSEDKFNLAAQGHRQPGSTFKMFVLTTAIKQGIDPYTTYYDSKPLDLELPQYGHWTVHTADEGYLGAVNLQQATVASDNTVFAQLDLDVGPDNVAATAKSMGVRTQLDGIPAEGLGGLRLGVTPLEMANSYATLAAGGVHRNPIAIEKVVMPDGRVQHPEKPDPKRVISPAVAYEVTRILHDNITGGTGTAAYTGCDGQAGKTGTTDNYVDAWFDGYQPNLATAVWVGYPDSNDIEMTSVHGITVFGGTFPADIWNDFYGGAGVPCEAYTKPDQGIEWSSFYGTYTAPDPTLTKPGKDEDDSGSSGYQGDNGTYYDPELYAPGAGQEPAPAPPAPPAPVAPAAPPAPPAAGGQADGGAAN